MNTVLHVDSLYGIDTNLGTLTDPIKTLSYAYGIAPEGSIIVLQNGDGTTYGDLSISKNVSIRNAYGATPKIGTLTISEAQGLFEGLSFDTLTDGIVVSNTPIGGISVKGCNFVDVDRPIDLTGVNYIGIHRNYMKNHLFGVTINDAVDVNISSNSFDDGSRSIEVIAVDRLDIWRNTIYGASSFGTTGTPDEDLRVIYKTLSISNITNKKVQLPGFATQNATDWDVTVDVVGGPKYIYGKDFIVEGEGSLVNWDGLGLTECLEAGDILRIMYSEGADPQGGEAIRVLGVNDPNSRIDSNNIGGTVSDIDLGVFFNTPIKLRYNNFHQSTIDFSGPTPTDDIGNFSSDPLYTDPLNGDLSLQPSSPDINAGDPIRWEQIASDMGVGLTGGGYTGINPNTREYPAPFNRDIDILGVHRKALGATGDVGSHEYNVNEGSTGSYVAEGGFDFGYPGSETAPYGSVDRGFQAGVTGFNIETNPVPYMSSATGPIITPTSGDNNSRYGRYRSRDLLLSDSGYVLGEDTRGDILFVYPSYARYETGGVFVSPDGNDNLPGSEFLPYRTIDKALGDTGSDYVIVKPGYYENFVGVTGKTLIGVEETKLVNLGKTLYSDFREASWTGMSSYTVTSKTITLTDSSSAEGSFEFNGNINYKIYGTCGTDKLFIEFENSSNKIYIHLNKVTQDMVIGYEISSVPYEFFYDLSSVPLAAFNDVKITINTEADKVTVAAENSYISESIVFNIGSGYGDLWSMSFESQGTGTSTVSNLVMSAGSFTGVLGTSYAPVKRKMFAVMSPTGLNTQLDPSSFPILPAYVQNSPTSQAIVVGGTITFTVDAGGGGVSYQWQLSASPFADIPGATFPSYTTPALTAESNGNRIRCIVSNEYGTMASEPALITVNDTPAVITSDPVSDSINVGQTASFSVTATGTTLTYQWQKDTVNISGATSDSYTTPIAVIGDNSSIYRCIVSNNSGDVPSASATLTVSDVSPVITVDPVSDSIGVDETASFSVTATGTTLTYQWQKDTVDILGAISDSYTTPSAIIGDSGSAYRCVVTNDAGSATSSSATLTVNETAIDITVDPVGTSKTVGETASFSVTATGTTLMYQWQKDTVNISGATSTTYVTPVLEITDNGNSYRCVVTNTLGSVNSAPAALVVTDVPVDITVHPSNASVNFGQSASFSVTATGTNLVYQWQESLVNISGANSSSYSISIAMLSDDGNSYRCVVSNSEESQNSNAASLSVADASVEAISFKDPVGAPNSNSVTYSPNTAGDRSILTDEILPDMKVYLDTDPGDMPFYIEPITNSVIYLTYTEVKDSVDLALKCWASVLPSFKYAFETDPALANFRFKFRTTNPEAPPGATGYSFLPTEAVSSPDVLSGDNTIYIAGPNLAFRTMDYISSLKQFEFKSSIRTRSSLERIFHFQHMQEAAYLPSGVTYPFIVDIDYAGSGGSLIPTEWLDELTKKVYVGGEWSSPIVWPNPGTPVDLTNPLYSDTSDPYGYLAVTGGANGSGTYPALTEQYFTNAILDTADHLSTFGRHGSLDIVYLLAHEFAHVILGAHDAEGPDSDSRINTRQYIEPLDSSVMDINNGIIKMTMNPTHKFDEITGLSSYSNLWASSVFTYLSAWNMRGVFDRDADRLASGSTDLSWTGYPDVSYPVTASKIELKKEAGDTYYTDDWHEAQTMMGWPTHKVSDNLKSQDTQWFLTDITLPASGDRYISNETKYGWTENYLYAYNGTIWVETIPSVDDVVKIGSDYYKYSGSTWVQIV